MKSNVSTEKLPFHHRSPIIPFVMYSVVSAVVYWLMGPPILILLIPFGVAYVIWFTWFRHRPIAPTTAFLQLYIVMYVVQILHLIEEWITGFYRTFPALWGDFWFNDPAKYGAWNTITFINGNLAMDMFWEIAILLLPKKNAWANYTVWLFLSGMVVNAIGHPLYSLWIASHGELQAFLHNAYGYNYTWYFPGLFTSFLHVIVVTLMIIQLRKNYKMFKGKPFPTLGEAIGSLKKTKASE
jgi:hypothetical protein